MRWILSLLLMSDWLFSMSSIEMSVSTLSLPSCLVLNFTISLSRCLSFSCTAYMRVCGESGWRVDSVLSR